MEQSRVEDQEKAIAVYHRVYEHESFEKSAHILVELVRRAEEKAPGKRRLLYLDIDGHRNSAGGFDGDMLELQRDFIPQVLMPFLSEIHTPLVNARNNSPQRNDVPETLMINNDHGIGKTGPKN